MPNRILGQRRQLRHSRWDVSTLTATVRSGGQGRPEQVQEQAQSAASRIIIAVKVILTRHQQQHIATTQGELTRSWTTWTRAHPPCHSSRAVAASVAIACSATTVAQPRRLNGAPALMVPARSATFAVLSSPNVRKSACRYSIETATLRRAVSGKQRASGMRISSSSSNSRSIHPFLGLQVAMSTKHASLGHRPLLQRQALAQ